MNIRLVQFSLGSGKRSVAEAIADKVVPAIRAQKGCVRCEFFADNEAGDYGIVVLWESKQAADAASSVIGPILTPALAEAKAASSIRLFDVYEPAVHMQTVHYKKDGIAMFPATTEKIFKYMREGDHKHAAFKSYKLLNVRGNVVTVDAEIYNPDGSTFKTTMTLKLNPPHGFEASMDGGAFSGAKITHSYTSMGDKTKVDLAGDFPAFPGMSEADELKMIDGFFTTIFAEDTTTLQKR